MKLPIIHHPEFQATLLGRTPNTGASEPDTPMGSPGRFRHRFPMGKYGMIAKMLVGDGLLHQTDFIVPEPVEFDMASRAHDARYVRQVFTASVDPLINREIGFDVNESVSKRARLSSGATLLAGRLALDTGIATSTAGGSHHARYNQGAGFCVFNDVAIASANLIAEGEVKSILVFDCDVHQGDGTAAIFSGDRQVTTVSIHSEKNYPVRKKASDIDVGLADKTGDEEYLEILAETLDRAIGICKPDLVFYNAGVDPHENDRLGRLSLTSDGLARRDRAVIGFFRARRIPVAAVQGGGYSDELEEVARRHTIIHHVANEFV